MPEKLLASFSNSGQYYAHISNDGKLRLWDVPSCVLKQEYTPDVHLTSPFTELRWISTSKKLDLSDSTKKRKTDRDLHAENEYIVLGSRSGHVFLYSVFSCNVISTFKNGHNSRVNSISWIRNLPNQMFTCSEDHYIIQWNIEDYSIKRKWKCGKLSCITLSPDGLSLVSAKKEIKWWDLSGEKEVLRKTYIGHSTDVYSLTFVQISGESCVLSAAVGNRLIHAWLLNYNTEERNALATFAMDDILVSISIWNSDEGGANILASSRTGVLHMYQCKINGKKYVKPIKPKLTVQIAADSVNEKAQVEQIPIISAAFQDDKSAYIAYGTDTILSFEKLSLNSIEKTMFIVRQDPKKKLLSNKEQSAHKILPTSVSKNVQYAHPDSVNGYIGGSIKKAQKRTNNFEKTVDVPLELRLENLIVGVPSTTTVPTSDSLVHLLLQGLKSKDVRILHDVLLNKEENVIKTTIIRLPVEAVIPLSIELTSMLQGKRDESNSAVRWLKQLLVTHAAHLISNPEITDIFVPVFPLVESRLNVLSPLCKLVGRLDLIMEQIKHRTEESEKSLQNVSLQPKLIYQDEDSEDDDKNDAFKEEIISNTDSDDHWDEISEIDEDSGQEQIQDVDMDNVDV